MQENNNPSSLLHCKSLQQSIRGVRFAKHRIEEGYAVPTLLVNIIGTETINRIRYPKVERPFESISSSMESWFSPVPKSFHEDPRIDSDLIKKLREKIYANYSFPKRSDSKIDDLICPDNSVASEVESLYSEDDIEDMFQTRNYKRSCFDEIHNGTQVKHCSVGTDDSSQLLWEDRLLTSLQEKKNTLDSQNREWDNVFKAYQHIIDSKMKDDLSRNSYEELKFEMKVTALKKEIVELQIEIQCLQRDNIELRDEIDNVRQEWFQEKKQRAEKEVLIEAVRKSMNLSDRVLKSELMETLEIECTKRFAILQKKFNDMINQCLNQLINDLNVKIKHSGMEEERMANEEKRTFNDSLKLVSENLKLVSENFEILKASQQYKQTLLKKSEETLLKEFEQRLDDDLKKIYVTEVLSEEIIAPKGSDDKTRARKETIKEENYSDGQSSSKFNPKEQAWIKKLQLFLSAPAH